MMGRGLWLLAAFAAVLSFADPAGASDSYCVSCSGPQATYLCEVSIPEGVVPTQSPQLYCAYKLASDGHHASCASRRAEAASCQGEARKLAYLGPSLSGPATVADPLPESGTPVPADASDLPTAEVAIETTLEQTQLPETEEASATIGSEDAAKDASRVTDAPIEDPAAPDDQAERSTGDKIAGVAKSAFNCLASFFKECKE